MISTRLKSHSGDLFVGPLDVTYYLITDSFENLCRSIAYVYIWYIYIAYIYAKHIYIYLGVRGGRRIAALPGQQDWGNKYEECRKEGEEEYILVNNHPSIQKEYRACWVAKASLNRMFGVTPSGIVHLGIRESESSCLSGYSFMSPVFYCYNLPHGVEHPHIFDFY